MRLIKVFKKTAASPILFDANWHIQSFDNQYGLFTYATDKVRKEWEDLKSIIEDGTQSAEDKLLSIQIRASTIARAMADVTRYAEGMRTNAQSLTYVGGKFIYEVVEGKRGRGVDSDFMTSVFGSGWSPEYTYMEDAYILTEKGAQMLKAAIAENNARATEISDMIDVRLVPLIYGKGYHPHKPEEIEQRSPWPGRSSQPEPAAPAQEEPQA